MKSRALNFYKFKAQAPHVYNFVSQKLDFELLKFILILILF